VAAAAWLQYAAVSRKLVALFATLALVLPVVAIGCGGGNDDGGSGNGISTEDNLKVDQDRADIDEFCTLSSSPKGELYERALITVVSAVDQVILIYKKDPGKNFHEPLKDRDIKMSQLVQDEAKKLKGCGKDGKAQAAKLTQASQSG
jgi:hypothetical protein